MADYSKHTTDKFSCHKCMQKMMYPNERGGKIMGFVCFFCGSVNYPTKDSLNKNGKLLPIRKGVDKMSKLLNAMEEDFTEVTILEKPALFTDMRIDRNTVPKGYYAYDVRHDDECQGEAVQLARSILVNHWGALITQEKIKLPRDGYLDIEPEDLNYDTGDCRTMKAFMAKYPPIEKSAKNKTHESR